VPIPATADPRTQTGEFYLGTSEDDSGGVDMLSHLVSGPPADRNAQAAHLLSKVRA
jgi:hypothetical protein